MQCGGNADKHEHQKQVVTFLRCSLCSYSAHHVQHCLPKLARHVAEYVFSTVNNIFRRCTPEVGRDGQHTFCAR